MFGVSSGKLLGYMV
jgi:hypothetical protein